MPTVAVTPGDVTPVASDAVVNASTYTGGATVTAGLFVYSDSSDSNELKSGQVSSAAAAAVVGMLLSPTSDGKPAVLITAGEVDTGGTHAKGKWYVLGAGGIVQEYSDLSSEIITWLGYGNAAGNLVISIHVTGETSA